MPHDAIVRQQGVGTRIKWFDKENRDSFDGTDMGKKVTYKHMGPEIFFKDEKGDQYHGTDNGEYEKLTPLITLEVHSTRLYRPNYGSGNNNSISGIAEDRSAGGGKSDPNSHYGPDGSYNLYTKNETDAVMNLYTNVAATLVGGPALKALGKAVIGVGSKLLPAAVNMLSKTSVAVNATATRGAVYLGSSSGAAYVAGGVEGVVKSYYGGPDVEFGSSIFGNPMSDAGLTTSSFLWAAYSSEK